MLHRDKTERRKARPHQPIFVSGVKEAYEHKIVSGGGGNTQPVIYVRLDVPMVD